MTVSTSKAALILLIALLAPVVHADIYTCTDEHGNVAYLQTPCPVEKVDEPSATDDEDIPEVEAEPVEEPYEPVSVLQSPEPPVASSRQPDEHLDDCKKRYRDQIDEIDAEMRTGYSPEEGAVYKQRLLALTRQLRACE